LTPLMKGPPMMSTDHTACLWSNIISLTLTKTNSVEIVRRCNHWFRFYLYLSSVPILHRSLRNDPWFEPSITYARGWGPARERLMILWDMN
jgi:hypothetical protein